MTIKFVLLTLLVILVAGAVALGAACYLESHGQGCRVASFHQPLAEPQYSDGR